MNKPDKNSTMPITFTQYCKDCGEHFETKTTISLLMLMVLGARHFGEKEIRIERCLPCEDAYVHMLEAEQEWDDIEFPLGSQSIH